MNRREMVKAVWLRTHLKIKRGWRWLIMDAPVLLPIISLTLIILIPVMLLAILIHPK